MTLCYNMDMGDHRHKLVYGEPGDPPYCLNCGVGVGVLLKRGRWVCSIAWRNQHGYNKKANVGNGLYERRTVPRSEHVIKAKAGNTWCVCGKTAVLASNDTWVCESQLETAERGIKRQRESPNPGGW